MSDETAETIGTAESKLTCFVIGPIGNRHAPLGSLEKDTYEESLRVMAEVVEPACNQVGLSPVRADDLARAGEITEQIFRRLLDDDVVIADLTGANANVMYELGLRHTRNKLTVQLGEYGRLPFDINTIRTIQFSRSPVGLINARDELIEVLSRGLAGEYDPVTATRIWIEGQADPLVAGGDGNIATERGPSETSESEDDEANDGFLDVLANAEERQGEMWSALDALAEHMDALNELAEASTHEIERSDAAGQGMRGRLQVATRYASGLQKIASDLTTDVDRFVVDLASVSAGNLALIKSLEEDPSQLDDPNVINYGMVLRRLAATSRTSLGALSDMTAATNENAKLSRVLREPSRQLTSGLNRLVEAMSVIDEWDRRLQSLGIPVPPDDWDPEGDSDDSLEPGGGDPDEVASEGDLDESETDGPDEDGNDAR